jgi:hypothetical protein
MITKPNKYTKCSFCKYWTGRGCMVIPNSSYCKEATTEYYNFLTKNKAAKQSQAKSLRAWDRHK